MRFEGLCPHRAFILHLWWHFKPLASTPQVSVKSRLSHIKRKSKTSKKNLNKRVNEETDSRRVEEEENNLGRNIKRVVWREGWGGRKEEEEERRWADSVLYVLAWVSPRASVMLYTDPLSRSACPAVFIFSFALLSLPPVWFFLSVTVGQIITRGQQITPRKRQQKDK